MEITVIKDEYNYKFVKCSYCSSELKIRKDTVQYEYRRGYESANVICPCCSKEFLIFK